MSDDFKRFWLSRAQAAAEARLLGEKDVDIHCPTCSYRQVTFESTDGQSLVARVVMPAIAASGDVPAVVMFHDMDRGARGWFHMTRFVAAGMACVQLERRLWSGDLTAGWEGGPDRLAMAQLVDDALCCAAVAARQDGIDPTRLIAWGEGLGAFEALAVAALMPQSFVRVGVANPMPADIERCWEAGAQDMIYAGLRTHFRDADPRAARKDALFKVLRYVDGVSFSRLLACPLLVGTGMLDAAALPQSQFAVVAAAREAGAAVAHVTYPKWGHERINDFEEEFLGFLHLKG